MADDPIVYVRRQPADWRIAAYRLSNISGLRWSDTNGGVRARLSGQFLCGFVRCDQAESGEVAHSCLHGRGPHSIKVCVTRKGNETVLSELLSRIPKPHARSSTAGPLSDEVDRW